MKQKDVQTRLSIFKMNKQDFMNFISIILTLNQQHLQQMFSEELHVFQIKLKI